MSLNQLIAKGRLTADPELKSTANGTLLLRFSIAVRRNYIRDGAPDTDFFHCVAWGAVAQFISRYFVKGQEIIICGELHNSSYTGKDAVKRTLTEVAIQSVDFCGPKPAGTSASEANSPENSQEEYPSPNEEECDLPF